MIVDARKAHNSFFLSLFLCFNLLGTRYQDVLRKIEIYDEEVFMDIDERDITKIDCALDISYSFVLSSWDLITKMASSTRKARMILTKT